MTPAPDPSLDWLADRPAPDPPAGDERLAELSPSPAARIERVHGHPALVHPSGRVIAVDLGTLVAVVHPAGLVVTWRELAPEAVPIDELRGALRTAFRQASRMAG